MASKKLETYMQFSIGLVLIFTVPFSVGVTDPQDVMAINSLFVALDYPPLQGWLIVGGDPCGDKWQGVECVFSNITALKLANANLGGELGETLDFGSIIEIDLTRNHIGGSIPSALPPSLRNFSLAVNQLTGTIPATLSSLTQLLDLSLNDNHLIGGIPDAFQKLTALALLNLSGNNLSGQLPPSLGNLSSLSILHLQKNQLSGTLDILQDLPLVDLNIQHNLFSGPIPANLLSIPNFRKDGNPFNTTILPSTPLAQPPVLATTPFPGGPLWKQSGPPFPQTTPKSEGAGKFLAAKTITWIAVAGSSVLLLLLCLLLSRCLRSKTKEKAPKDKHFDKVRASTENPKHGESSLQKINQIENVSKEAVVKPLDNRRLETKRMGLVPKLLDEQTTGVKRTEESSICMNDNESDLTDIDRNFLPPPPPLPFPIENNLIDPVGPAKSAKSGHSLRGLNLKSVKIFSVASLQQYTNSFSSENFIGDGMLGSVYRAELPAGKLLAVKKLESTVCRQQSDAEFLELVSTLSKLQHTNVVKLVGYCAEWGQRLLVYEYCENGTLFDALHVVEEIHQKLSWNRRIQVALGAARALEYLHEICQPPIMHCNFKSSNLLLNDNLEVSVSDCGLAPLLSSVSTSSHLLDTHGSGAPEFESVNYTCQSDVYSFGVVLLELLTGRKPYDRSRPRGEQHLVRWAVPKLHDIDSLSRMVDPSLHGVYPIKSVSRFADIITSCVQGEPEFRPPISEIVEELLQMT